MTPDRIAEIRSEIDRLIPDGFSVLYRLSGDRSCSRSEWEELREHYVDRVTEFYELFAPAWDVLPVSDRIKLCRKSGWCHRTSLELSARPWSGLTPSAKRMLYKRLDIPVTTAGP